MEVVSHARRRKGQSSRLRLYPEAPLGSFADWSLANSLRLLRLKKDQVRHNEAYVLPL